MRIIICSILLLLSIFLACCTTKTPPEPAQEAKAYLLNRLDTLQTVADKHLLRLAKTGDEDSLRLAFRKTRLAYKKVELFTEYYAPTASKEMNGAPLPELEVEETTAFEPSGLQVIEEYLYPAFEEANRDELIREVLKFISVTSRARSVLQETDFTDAHIFNACRQEIFRIMVLGFTGFDTPLTTTGVQEAAIALESVREVLQLYGQNPKVQNLLTEAIANTAGHQDFDSFDRMAFITRFANPVTAELVRWQEQLNIAPLSGLMAVSAQTSSLFEESSLSADYFAGTTEGRITPARVALGKKLFFDPKLSGNTSTCGSCHKPELAFTDGLPTSAALEAGTFVQRNAPTLYYAGLQHAQFYDMRAHSLESQAVDVLRNKQEMHGSVEEAAQRLNQYPEFVYQFRQAFPDIEVEVQPKHVMLALATYVRSLTPFSSRFDKHMRGQEQLTPQEVKGFNLFMGKGKCGTCHFMPLFNGTAAPAFTNTEAEVLGVLQNPRAAQPIIDPDQGRYNHGKMEELRFAFKTPTLRNITKTAPYMHNGAYKTLEEVMNFYNKGGAQGLGLQLENQTLPPDSLHLTEEESQSIIVFMQTLTDEI
ncbi:cytochrome-c peroxidase [Pontibacter sp. 13R65]|uniref:cytochrome-c peroxidase n=1 Tax=Pontibacter sp. 13R65 TaxID=3127458 RepID=UPI00301D3CD8